MAPSPFSVPTTSANVSTSVASNLIVVETIHNHREKAECSILVCLSVETYIF
jgi:hypothetical protein